MIASAGIGNVSSVAVRVYTASKSAIDSVLLSRENSHFKAFRLGSLADFSYKCLERLVMMIV